MQQTLTIKKYIMNPGSLSDLQIRETSLEPPQTGEVRISVKAIGLNFADVFTIWGLYKAAPKKDLTPGLEYAGLVESVGPDVTSCKPGDRVFGVTRFGAYATHLNIDARYVMPLPADWDFATGAAYPVQSLTAYYAMVYLGNLQKQQNILIHSAVGGVGLQALKIARAYNCFTIGTIGTGSKTNFALNEGYDRVIVRGDDFKSRLTEALGDRPLDLVLDSIGGKYFTIPFEMLTPMGRLVVFGSARYASVGNRPNLFRVLYHWVTRPKIDPQQLPETNRAVLGFNLIWLYERAPLMQQMLHELEALHLQPPHVGHTFPFEQMQEAIRLFQSGRTVGKVVVLTDN
jgi:alcohol dehydrogenase